MLPGFVARISTIFNKVNTNGIQNNVGMLIRTYLFDVTYKSICTDYVVMIEIVMMFEGKNTDLTIVF